MIDRERVIANLTNCQKCLCDECDLEHASHYIWDCEANYQLINNALELLKEQKTTFMKDGHHIMCKSCGAYWCDRDREGDLYPQNFCPNCGKAAEWELNI